MKGFCKVFILGRLGNKKELKTAKDFSLMEFSLAVNTPTKNEKGTWEDHTSWYNITVFNKLAEVVSNYVNVGDMVYVGCTLKERKWKDKDGEERKILGLTAYEVQFISTKPKSSSTEREQQINNKTQPNPEIEQEMFSSWSSINPKDSDNSSDESFDPEEDDYIPFA